MKIKLSFFLIILSFFAIFSEEKKDLFVESVEFIGLKFARKRVEKELVIKKDDIWDREKVENYLNILKKDNIIEAYEIIEEISSEKQNYVNIKINISEKLPLFAFILPFYSNSAGFKAKFKYWHFYIDGYKTPIEGQIEYLAKENFNLFLRTNEPIKLNDNISMSFDFTTYTSTVNYLATLQEWHNNVWESGIENLYFKIYQKIPDNINLNYSLGFGYGNVITTEFPYDLLSIKDQDHIFLLNPFFEFEVKIKKINGILKSEFGIGYKNLYSKTKEDLNYNKNEINISSFGNNPRSPKEALLNPVRLIYFEVPFDKPDSRLFTGFKFALKNSFNQYGDGKSYDNILIKEFDYSTFENSILNKIEKEDDKNFLSSRYLRDTDKNKYVILENLSDADKERIWAILIDTGYITNNGIYTSPYVGWTFYFYNKLISLTPSISFAYKTRWESIDFTFNEINITPSLSFNYNIKIIDAIFRINLDATYTKYWDNNGYNDKIYINKINFSFEKKFEFDKNYLKAQQITEDNLKKSSHEIRLNFNIYADPVFTYDSKIGSIPATNNFKTIFEALYKLYLPVYKDHRYRMRVLFFATYNSITEKIMNDLFIGNYLRGKGVSYFGGYTGLIVNIEYWLPLFTINMSKFLNKSFGKDFEWQMFWVFYIDAGISLNDVETEFTLDRNFMHILPAFIAGTAFKVYPKFVPLVVNLEVNFNLYNMVKSSGSFTSYIFFEFSVSRIIE
ncbi:MAG TPA: hypothetical protein PLE45_09825 [Spirochaetota bacterium]|nr:hypothetical protein [Spirochaetota bacterium]HOL57410.1 hypothetical protein [Spirochaetota bacterium]HPP04496.1 hypothetical protein [Spirochaetota bacterium]